MTHNKRFMTGLLGAVLLSPISTYAQNTDGAQRGQDRQYEVTITNISSTVFTPLLAVAHNSSISLFETGAPASDELALLAEGGATGPLTDVFDTVPDLVGDYETSGGLLMPGATTTLVLNTTKRFDHLSVAAMLLPTNDSFVGLNSVELPRKKGHTVTYTAIGYDAGSEPNDELCANIPGPQCMGAGPSPGADGEGFVKVSAGIHGEGDLNASDYDWRNPVAKISVTRVRQN